MRWESFQQRMTSRRREIIAAQLGIASGGNHLHVWKQVSVHIDGCTAGETPIITF